MHIQQNILIIEDDPSLRRTLDLIFSREGFQVTSTSVNQKVLDLLEVGAFNLVVLDLCKTNDRGLALFFRVKKDYPSLPIILLSSGQECGAIPHIEDEGSWVKVSKPFEPFFLLETALEMTGTTLSR